MGAPRHPRQKTLLATVFLLNGIEFLQAGMMAFGAGPIMAQISASPEEYTFGTLMYACVAISAIALQRWLVERLGWRQFIHYSLALFITGAAICATSTGFDQFLLGRAVMGLGGAAFMTSARVLINLIPPSPERMKGIAAFAVALVLGNAGAPWITSVAVTSDVWYGGFVVLIGMALLAALAAAASLPTDIAPDDQRTHSTPWLVALIFGSSFLLLYALQRAAYDFYSNAWPLVALVLAGVAGLILMLRHQHGHERPLLAVRRLVQKRYLSGLALFSLCYVILGANNIVLPVLMQRALGYPWQVIGQVQSIGLLAGLPAFIIMVLILKRSPGPRKFYAAGFATLCYSGWQLAHLNAGANLLTDVLPAIAGFGAFVILVMATTAIQTFRELEQDELAFTHGQMLKNMMSQFGIALGVAAGTLGMQWRTSVHYSVLNERFSAGDAGFSQLLSQLTAYFGAAQDAQQAPQLAMAQLVQLLNQQATLLAGLDYFWALMLLSLAGATLMLFQRTFK